MLQTVTAKLQIRVDPSDHEILHQTMQAYCGACQFISDYIFQTKEMTVKALHHALYRRIRDQFFLPSQMACSCLRTVTARYKALLPSGQDWPRIRFRHPHAELVWNRDYSLSRSQDLFSVNTLKGRIRVPFCSRGFEQYFREDCRFGTATLIFRHGKFYLHVPVSCEIGELPLSEVTHVVGIDRGIRFPAVSYDSDGKTRFFSGSVLKQKRAHYMALRRDLQKIGSPSSRRRLRRIGQRENRWMRDVNHCIAKALCDSNPAGTLFVIEDLKGIRRATERVKVKDRSLSVSWSYSDLEQKLTYKALRNHQQVVKADAAYTSQRCPVCGHTQKENRDKRRHCFCCRQCGYRSNDDRIAAMNLHRMGMELFVPDAGTAEHDSAVWGAVSRPAM